MPSEPRLILNTHLLVIGVRFSGSFQVQVRFFDRDSISSLMAAFYIVQSLHFLASEIEFGVS